MSDRRESIVIVVELNQTAPHAWIDGEQLREAIRRVTSNEGFSRGNVSLAIVDDPTIHELNRRHLQHDYPTDVLSFVLHREADHLDGEVIVSADTAESTAADYDWPPAAELLLYVIHGTLHLVGFDDKSPEKRVVMRAKEAEYLDLFGWTVPAMADEEDEADAAGGSP
ncbi:MAG: rRNA maturation RNase YbeY [Planctomycetales bacterium]|nr:rRNA maturation RNase YbeY [Planctomycetales bacterium]MCA9228465.1 rRNA maturation RNase YbeY [Planctomycetales bacterium]